MVERSHLSYQLYQRKRKSINNWRKFHKIFFGIKFTHYAYGQYVQKKKITGIYFNSNYRAEMKVVLIITDYCLLQFDSLKFFLGVQDGNLHGGHYLTLIFFNVIPQIFQRNCKDFYKKVFLLNISGCIKFSFTPIIFKRKIFLAKNSHQL